MVLPKAGPASTRRTISRDLTLSLALMTVLVVSGFGIVFGVYYTNREITGLETEAADIADEFAGVLARPLWNMDGETVTQIAKAYLSSDFLTGVSVKTGQEIFFNTIPQEQHPDHWLVLKRDIESAGETIGSVELLFSKARLRSINRRWILMALVTIVLVTAVIGFGTHQLMKRLLVIPLNRLMAGIRTIAAGNYQLAMPMEKHADINGIISEINIMAQEIDRRESDLKKLRTTLQNIIDSMPSVLVGVNPDGRVNQWNREAEKMTGIDASRALGSAIENIYPSLAVVMQKADRVIKEKRPHKESKVSSLIDGQLHYSDITIFPLTPGETGETVIRVDDITDRVRIEEMMVQSEKMLSIGGLAAGMAHEINNPLAGILQNIQVMRNRLSGSLEKNHVVAEECGIRMADIQAYMERRSIPAMVASIMDSGQRAARIVENMLSFSRKSEATATMCDLSSLMDATLELAENDYDLKKRYDFRQIAIIRE
jgi:PAS domain S-box-containing protein